MNIEELHRDMSSCFQFENMNMLDHGRAVNAAYTRLMSQFNGGEFFIELPPQINDLYQKLKASLFDDATIAHYHLYHDCGKPYVLTISEEGRRHYPNHAAVSADYYSRCFPGNGVVANLILRDMDFHTLKGEELIELCKQPYAATLYFTAWAEIIANSEMFGGFDSTSFKIKKKALISAGKKFAL